MLITPGLRFLNPFFLFKMEKKEHNEYADQTIKLLAVTYGFILGGIVGLMTDLLIVLCIASFLELWLLLSFHKIKKSIEEK